MSRWIKLSADLLGWRWHDEPKTMSFWIHCLLSASSEDKDYKTSQVKRGEFTMTYAQLSALCGLSVQEVRTCIKKLVKTGEITAISTNAYTRITICNYDSYQRKNFDSNKPPTNEQQTINIPPTSEQQASNIPSTTIIRYKENIDNKNIEKEQKQQEASEPQFFKTWEDCKEYLTGKGRTCTDKGYEKFFSINQIGSEKQKPYWYKDGVLDSFDYFMSIDSNRKRFLPKNKQNSPPGSAHPPNAPLWQTSPHEYWNIHIGNISKKVWADEANLINTLEFKGISDKNELIITSPRMNEIQSSKTLLSMINGEFRGMKFKIV